MPSQEENLDDLLNKLIEDDTVVESMKPDEHADEDDSENQDKADIGDLLSLDDLQELMPDEEAQELFLEKTDEMLKDAGVDDIERMLNESRELAEEEPEISLDVPTSEKEELENLLSASGDDADLSDIQDMLEKSDNNEAIDADALAKISQVSDDAASVLNEENAEKETPAEKKARIAEEKKKKKEAKKQAKEAKKAEKELKKAQRATSKNKKNAVSESVDGDNDDNRNGGLEYENLDVSAEMDALINDALADDNSKNIHNENSADEADSTKSTDSTYDAGTSDEEFFEDDFNDMMEMASSFVSNDTDESMQPKEVSIEDADLEIRDKDKPAKKSFFARLLDFFTEEDEDENAEEEKGTEDIQLSEENQNILNELDSEDNVPAKGKKKGKDKKSKDKKSKDKKDKKGKKDKAAKSDEGADEVDDAGEGQEESGKKPKKEKKKKKEKQSDAENGTAKKEKKLSTRRVMLIVLTCASILIVIILITGFTGDYSVKREGRQAFNEGDYQTCYQNLYGKNLNESEKVMFSRSECILRIRLWLREYEMLVEEGSETGALDSLIQSVNDYPLLYEYATEWNSTAEVEEGYTEILSILSEKYGLTEEQAKEIAAIEDDTEYTKAVIAACEGKGYPASDTDSTNPQVTDNAETLKDLLPEEQGMVNSQFIDNK